MPSSIVLPQFFVPKAAVTLGRFITSIETPYDGHDPECSTLPQLVELSREAFTAVHQDDSKSRFALSLTSLMSAGFSKRAETKIRIVSDLVKSYYLAKPDDWFEEATQVQATRQWLERKYDRGYAVFMIVGFHTVTDARIVQQSSDGESTGGKVQIPVSLSLAAAGIIVPLGNLIDPSVTGEQQAGNKALAQFVAPGEQVCAVQYRKISHRWFSSRDLDNSRLSNTSRWVSVEMDRLGVELEDDAIEVVLQETEGVDGQWDKEAVGDELLLYRPPQGATA